MMSADADALCAAEYGQVSEERVTSTMDTAHADGTRPHPTAGGTPSAGTIEPAITKLRLGSYPDLAPGTPMPRRPSPVSVDDTAYLIRVSTRSVEELAESLGDTQLTKSQVSARAKHLDE
jgi:transposase-like protein